MAGMFGLSVALAFTPAVVRADAVDEAYRQRCEFTSGNWSQDPYNGNNVCTCHNSTRNTNTAFNPYSQFCFAGDVFNDFQQGAGGGGGYGGGVNPEECGLGMSWLECQIWLALTA